MWSDWSSHILWVQNGIDTQQFLVKLNIHFPYNPAITLLHIHPSEMKTYIHTEICTWLSMVVCFLIAKNRKQPKCPWIGECIINLSHIHTLQYYSAIKKNKGLKQRQRGWIFCILHAPCQIRSSSSPRLANALRTKATLVLLLGLSRFQLSIRHWPDYSFLLSWCFDSFKEIFKNLFIQNF